MDTQLEQNKSLVKRYNRELIEQGNAQSAEEILDAGFINRTGVPGQNGRDALMYFFNNILRVGIPDVTVAIEHQVAEGDLVTTHKRLQGTHSGELMGIPATGRAVSIEVIDILKIREGKVTDHWGFNTLSTVLADLAKG